MNKKELDFVLQEGEGLKVEFKETVSNLDKEIVAFANTIGGRIFIGINDNNKVIGATLTNRLKSQIMDVARNCDPPIDIALEYVDKVIIISIPESLNKPHKCSSGFYLRKEATSQKMSQKEIVDFILSLGKKSFDSLPNQQFKLKDISPDLVERYLQKAGVSNTISLAEKLFNLGVADERGAVNNAGILFFCENPKKYFIQAYVTCARYLGTAKVKVLDRKDFEGDLVSQIDESIKFVQRNTRLEYEIKEIRRKEIPEYPTDAIREAIINALMHRDYVERGSNVQVDIFDDRIEISNVGGLIKPLTKEKLGMLAVRRNPLIADLLHRIDYVEKMGTGLKRIKDACVLHGVTVEVETNGFFIITFRLKPIKTVEKKVGERVGGKVGERVGGNLTKNQSNILLEMSKDKFITAEKLSKAIGISQRKIEENISKLKEKNLLIRVGPDKGGHWEVKHE